MDTYKAKWDKVLYSDDVDLFAARETAYSWHGGQESALYSFASTDCTVWSEDHRHGAASRSRPLAAITPQPIPSGLAPTGTKWISCRPGATSMTWCATSSKKSAPPALPRLRSNPTFYRSPHMRYSKAEVQESLTRLRKLCPPGTTIHCVLRHVSRSGMMRHISLFKGTQSISWDAARVLGYPLNDGHAHWAVKVGGCGMDMGFHLVNSLSYALHGYKDRGDPESDRRFGPRRGHFRAGYSLKHAWL